jgi:hypothetical protein
MSDAVPEPPPESLGLLRKSYVALAFAINRLHTSARVRDGELCTSFANVRAEIEKHFKSHGVQL